MNLQHEVERNGRATSPTADNIAVASCGRRRRPSTQPADDWWSRERYVVERRMQNLETS